jgi:hypothetical protein
MKIASNGWKFMKLIAAAEIDNLGQNRVKVQKVPHFFSME